MAVRQLTFINNSYAKLRDTVLSALGYTPENVANKTTQIIGESDIKYPTENAVFQFFNGKQDVLNYDPEIGAFILQEEEYES